MRPLFILSTLLVLGSCTPSAEVSSGSSSSKNINAEAPFIWKKKTFPKTIQISSAFDDDEEQAIEDAAAEWKAAAGNRNWFSFGANTNNAHNIESPDAVMGVYKTTSWPSDIDEDALAITQLFGRRYNVGDADEYVSIEHADILVNYQPGPYAFTFDSIDENPAPVDQGFDLRTVIVHEMGHFMGLSHIPSYYDREEKYDDMDRDDYKELSVMYPSISSTEEKRVPQLLDVNALLLKYPLSSGGAHAMVSEQEERFKPKSADPGKNVRIVIELKKDGECIHKENGAVFKRHSLKRK